MERSVGLEEEHKNRMMVGSDTWVALRLLDNVGFHHPSLRLTSRADGIHNFFASFRDFVQAPVFSSPVYSPYLFCGFHIRVLRFPLWFYPL